MRTRPLLDNDRFRRLLRARDYLAQSAGQSMTVEDAARVAHLSKFHFLRLYEQAFGESPVDFLTRQRMDRARQILRGGSLTVTETCLEVGYQSLGTFSSRFKRFAGVAPSEYRRMAL